MKYNTDSMLNYLMLIKKNLLTRIRKDYPSIIHLHKYAPHRNGMKYGYEVETLWHP